MLNESEVKEVEKEVIEKDIEEDAAAKLAEGEKSDESQSKNQESLEDREARLERQLRQTRKKLGIDDAEPAKKTSKSDGLDYGEKAYLVANGIKGSSETKLVQEIMADTGKSLEDVIDSKYFQAELKELRELEASSVTIKGKRSSGVGQDSVDYWLAKGELPPASEVKLRRDVVNARLKKSSNKGVFYNS